MDTIKLMRTFVAVAHEGTFTAAAKRLRITTKLASKYVAHLEERLGAQLFNRTTRKVALTETGSAYLERCQPILEQFEELEGLVQERQSDIAGSIRMTASTAFGSTRLVEAIKPFLIKHPKVSIDLHLSDQRVAIIEEGFDLAFRFGTLEDSSLIARKLMDMRVVVCASPDYLKRHGQPAHPSALATHNCLIQRASLNPEHWQFRLNGNDTAIRVTGRFQANAPRAIAEMAASGHGIGRCPLYVLEPYLKDGSLVLLFEEYEAPGFGLYAVYPPNRHLTARVRAMIDHLAKTFA